MTTIAQLLAAFEDRNWEIKKVEQDYFEYKHFDEPTYEICLDGRNVFYLELTEFNSDGTFSDGSVFKFGKEGEICESWSLSGMENLTDVLNLIFAFSIQS